MISVETLYSGSLSSGSDVKHTDTAFKRMHTLLVFACAQAGQCAQFPLADLGLRLANKRTTSLPENSDTEYSYLFTFEM